MADPAQVKEFTKIFMLCISWYIISATNNVVGKTVLNVFPYPVTVTMVQLLSITLYSGPVLSLWGVRRYVDISWKYYFKIIVPLSLGKFFASVTSHVSIWKVPVSYAHTVKATMPLFTVILSRVILGEKQTNKVYISLAPIIIGVFIATMTELSYDSIGLISALLATLGFSLQNIFSKKVLRDTNIHHLRLLHLLARLSLALFIPFWAIFDVRKIMRNDHVIPADKIMECIFLLFADGLLNFLQNLVAFTVLNFVSPLTYSVASASKRIFVIIISLMMLRNPVTGTNVFGMMTAVFGVLWYNKAKYDANLNKKKASLLPLTNNESPLLTSQMNGVYPVTIPSPNVMSQTNGWINSV